MKIQFAIPYHYNLYDTILGLREHDVHVLSQQRVRPIPSEIHNQIISSKTIRHIGLVFSFRDLWKYLDADVVITKHISTPSSLQVMLVCKLKRIPYVVNIQKFPRPHTIAGRFVLRLLILFTRKSTPVYAISPEEAQQAAQHFTRVDYIPTCINPSRFKQKTKFSHNHTLRIICVAKYQRRKNHQHLIDAVAQLIESHPTIHFHLTFVGTNFSGKISKTLQAERDVYPALIHQAQERDLSTNISFLANIPNTQMNDLYCQHDLFILPASHEPLGFALLEAMACGLPVIATDEVGAKSSIQHNKNGYTCTARDTNALKKSIEKFIDAGRVNTKKLKKFGAQSRLIIEQEHAPTIFAKRFEELLHHVH